MERGLGAEVAFFKRVPTAEDAVLLVVEGEDLCSLVPTNPLPVVAPLSLPLLSSLLLLLLLLLPPEGLTAAAPPHPLPGVDCRYLRASLA